MKNKNTLLAIFAILGMILFMPFSAFAQEEPPTESAEPTPELVSEPVEEEVVAEEVSEEPEDVSEESEEEAEGVIEEEKEESSFGQTVPTLTIQVEQIAWNQFRFRPSSRLGVTDVEYIWQLGDGQRVEERIVDYTYDAPGTYQVELGVIDSNGTPQMATVPVQVGFFHLANWRLWILIGLLAVIIILAAIVAGITDSLVPKVSSTPLPKKQPMPKEPNEPLEPLSEETGDLDSLATTGMDTTELSDELALLESLDNTDGAMEMDDSDPLAALDGLEESEPEVPEVAAMEETVVEEPVAAPKPKAAAAKKKKAAPKKKATKKKTTTKKKASAAKKKPAKKKAPAKKKSTKKK